MKRLTITLLLVIGFAISASAHHNSPSDSAGGNIADMSGHLDLEF